MFFPNMHSAAIIALLSSSSPRQASAFVITAPSPPTAAAAFHAAERREFKPSHSEIRHRRQIRWTPTTTGDTELLAGRPRNVQRTPMQAFYRGIDVDLDYVSRPGSSSRSVVARERHLLGQRRRNSFLVAPWRTHVSNSNHNTEIPPPRPASKEVQGNLTKDTGAKKEGLNTDTNNGKLNTSATRQHSPSEPRGDAATSSNKRSGSAHAGNHSSSNNNNNMGGMLISIPMQIPGITEGWNKFTGNSNATAKAALATEHARNEMRTVLHESKKASRECFEYNSIVVESFDVGNMLQALALQDLSLYGQICARARCTVVS